jgi:hypothetical protein
VTEPAAAAAAAAEAVARAKGRRIKNTLMLAAAVLALLTLITWTQVWFGVTLVDGTQLEIAGEVAAPALSALALASLVLVGALSIAGPFFRLVFGLLESLIGVAVVSSAVIALTDPVVASASAISGATGVAGAKSVAAFVDTVDQGLWPWLALVAGVLVVLAGLAVIVTARRWPGSSRKYNATRLEPAKRERTAVDDWDALSGGDDPTTND